MTHKDTKTAVKMLMARLLKLGLYYSGIESRRDGLYIYVMPGTDSAPYPKTCGGHRVKVTTHVTLFLNPTRRFWFRKRP